MNNLVKQTKSLTIILDLDFCLFDTNSMRDALAEQFRDFFAVHEFFKRWSMKQLIDKAWATAPHNLVEELECPSEVAEAFLNFYRGLKVPQDVELYPDVSAALETLQRQETPLFLVTKGIEEFQRQKVEVLGIEYFFQDIVYVGPDSKIKTKKQAFEALAVGHQFSLCDTLVVGDSNDELTAGRKLGATTVQTRRPGIKRHDADHHVSDLHELLKLLPRVS